jgi:pimeloyl-ACP methyl ester carboxylesterase
MKLLNLCAAMALAIAPGMGAAQMSQTPEIAKALPGLGYEMSREMVGGTFKLYGPLHAGSSDDGLSVIRDLAYGPHERNVLDVYAPQGAAGVPVMVFVHGGGFVRGDKKDVTHIGRWFAQNGVAAINVNYRFAPQSTWPSGAQDLGLVLDWIKANAGAHGIDPAKIVLAGNSAGSMHVADYVFREELQRDGDGVIGAILISTPTVDLENRPVDPKRDALYYGTDGDRAAQSVVNAVEGRKIPLMLAYAEHEPQVIMDQVRRLAVALTERDGRLPLLKGVQGHNHISVVQHIGTADQSLAPDMLGFINNLAMD